MKRGSAAWERQRLQVKAQSAEYNYRWVLGGKKLTRYICPHCGNSVETPRPRKIDVSSKGYWDSAKTCVECGEVNFLKVWPDGKTSIEPLFTNNRHQP